MTTRAIRKIVRIDEEKCNGCGVCVSPCAEGAIHIVDGKAKVIQEELCDGAGVCLGVCPQGAMTIEEREANEFSEEAVREYHASQTLEAQATEADRITHTTQAQASQITDEGTHECGWCRKGDGDRPLLQALYKGQSTWICVKCLPQLIHG